MPDNNDDILQKSLNFVNSLTSTELPLLRNEIETYLKSLNPLYIKLFRYFIYTFEGTQNKYKVLITSGFRSYNEQSFYYSQDNRNAKPGTSLHESGLAIDINLINTINPNDNLTKSSNQVFWRTSGIVQLAESLGITWGGTFFGYEDNVHFEISKSLKNVSVDQLKQTQNFLDRSKTVTYIINTEDGISVSNFIKEYNLKNPLNNNQYISDQELINYGNNRDSILNSNTPANKIIQKKNITTIPKNAKIEVPVNIIGDKTIYAVNKTLTISNNSTAFIEKSIGKLLAEDSYKKLNNSDSKFNDGILYKKELNCAVYIWSKSLSPKGDFFLNVTPLVLNISTNCGKSGGNFTIFLPNINLKEAEIDSKFPVGKEFLHKTIYDYTQNIDSYHKVTTNDVVDNNDSKINTIFRRNNSFFNQFLQAQDLVFIKFEKLENEKSSLNQNPKVSAKDLDGNLWDMIGLITKVNSNENSNEQSVSITGMDLSKLLIDDGVMFFPISYGTVDSGNYIKQTIKDGIEKRLTFNDPTNSNFKFSVNNSPISDRLDIFNFGGTVEEWLVWMFSRLTTIGVIADDLMNGYSSNDTTMILSKSEKEDKGVNTQTYKKIQAVGIWKICKLIVDKNLDNRRLADTSIASSTGNLYSIIKKVAQEPFIEMIMDTWGHKMRDNDPWSSKYCFIFRQSPFSQAAFKSLPCISIYEEDVYNESLSWCDEIYSSYRLIPRGSALFSQDEPSLLFAVPAVIINEYVAIWGVKTLEISSNFLDLSPVESVDNVKWKGDAITQNINDLDWLIQTHSLLPFTRQGTITVKGDRRIKRGMLIRYFPTGELFYVVGVNNVVNFEGEVQRTTTFQVVRGIVEKDYDKYFNIVKRTKTNVGNKQNEQTNNQNIGNDYQTSNWQINKHNFDYLLSRRQTI